MLSKAVCLRRCINLSQCPKTLNCRLMPLVSKFFCFYFHGFDLEHLKQGFEISFGRKYFSSVIQLEIQLTCADWKGIICKIL